MKNDRCRPGDAWLGGGVPNKRVCAAEKTEQEVGPGPHAVAVVQRGGEGREERLIELTGELPTALIMRGH